jgi:hypothetical protein
MNRATATVRISIAIFVIFMIASSQMSYLARKSEAAGGRERQRLEMRPVAFFTTATTL